MRLGAVPVKVGVLKFRAQAKGTGRITMDYIRLSM
jgi:hypothetical protein